MDRISFSKSIDVDPVTQVKCYFTEIMAMYNLCEGRNYNLLRGFINEENSIQFLVAFNSPMEAMSVASNILNTSISLYNKIFYVEGELSNSELSLTFRQKNTEVG